MDAIALLSSLATDLDLMLSDLRSTPNRFIQSRSSVPIQILSHQQHINSHHHQHNYHHQLGSENTTSLHLRSRHLPIGSIDIDDGGGGGGLLDDDLQALLPGGGISRDELSQSRASLVSSSDGGILAEGETSSESSGDSTSPPCDLGLVERLLRTHPVWFLPGIQRAGAVHLLQGKEEGNFIVRGSSQPNTMAVSVRLPPNTGPYIEHYLIQSNDGQLSLESSRFKFDSIPGLIAHYAQCCDELPVQLTLPRALREAKNRQQLSSVALLGQEFWRYPMATPKTEDMIVSPNEQIVPNSHPQHNVVATLAAGVLSQAETPSDTTSSLSSFTSTGQQQLLSPESIDSVILTMSPVESCRTGIVGKTSTFKALTKKFGPLQSEVEKIISPIPSIDSNIRAPRPTPPNTLNLAPLRIAPPAPPPRWSKPPTPISPTVTEIGLQSPNNFTVTTTVTFSVEGNQNSQVVEVTSPNNNNSFQTISKRLSPEGECKQQTVDTLSSQGSKRFQGRMRRSKARKESKHYQESDILESPSVYCRSALGDKISDYEDLWSQDNAITLGRGNNMSSFRPDGSHGKRPDLLPETPTITSLNGNLLSPAGSSSSSNPSSTNKVQETVPSIIQTHVQTQSHIIHQQLRYIDDEDSGNRIDIDQTEDFSKNIHLQIFASQNQMLQPRNRLGLILPNQPEPVPEENMSTPIQTPVNNRNKQGSPFYAEPADALNNIIRRGQPLRQLPTNQRFSEPPKGPLRVPPTIMLSPTESEKIKNAGSLDELKKKHRKTRGKLDPWPLDSSWEFMGNEEENDYDTDVHWRTVTKTTVPKQEIKQNLIGTKTKSLTVHQIISKRLPELNLPELVRCSTPADNNNDGGGTLTRGQRISAYDNVEKVHSGYATSLLNCIDSAQSDDGTVFSEPWDSSQWDSFLPQDDSSDTIHLSKCRPAVCLSEDDTIIEESICQTGNKTIISHPQKLATIIRNRSCRDREILCHPRNKAPNNLPGQSISAYTLSLASDRTSTFSRNIENFISCTKESREIAPQIVMRNMRQFMSGMKNYLVKHGEGDFQREVQRAREHLKSDEFLNLDTILESVMHRLVVLPLREHLYSLFVDYYTRSGDIQLLVENVKYASGRTAIDFGIRSSVTPPSTSSLRQISSILVRLQEAELPLEKLELLLTAVSSVYEATGCPRGQQLSADDFLPLLVLVVAKCGFIGAEIEAEFMWGLLQPSLLSGEAGYYLTALCSAVHVLKSFMSSENEGTGSLDLRSSFLPASSSVLRVIIPDECNGSLQTRTLPVRPHTTTREVCRTIAHKARITNPQDYGLFKLVDGEETLLMDNECPQDVRISARGKHCMLAYKRIDAKIAWPTLIPSSF